MRTFYTVLTEFRANPSFDVARNYLVEMLVWFSQRLPVEQSPVRLCKDIDASWRNFVKRAGTFQIDGIDYQLTDNMFRQCLAQLPIIESTPNGEFLFRMMFKELKWDYDAYVDPKLADREEIILIDINSP